MSLGIGFIGAGDVSDLHARAIRSCGGAQLLGLWNRTPSTAASKATRFGCRHYETAEELIADPAIDAVFVLTNLETHFHYTTLALKGGKHVLVEKPVGANTREIEEMQRLATDPQKLLCVPGPQLHLRRGPDSHPRTDSGWRPGSTDLRLRALQHPSPGRKSPGAIPV